MPAASLPATRDVKELDSVSSEEDRDETRLEEIQQEQRQLLRKADLFMERLFNARSASDEERRRELPALTPPLQTRRRIEPDRAPPSLVIGKLTVEVTPPAPPATAPAQQQVVVVREGDGSRSSFHSSRRFGLSQF
jgi:hypothetical protein